MPDLKGFKFPATLVLVLQNIESENETNYETVYTPSKAETIVMKVTVIIMYLNQSKLQLYQTKFRAGLLSQS